MEHKDTQIIKDKIDFITFKKFVENITNVTFDEIYVNFLSQGETNAKSGQTKDNLG